MPEFTRAYAEYVKSNKQILDSFWTGACVWMWWRLQLYFWRWKNKNNSRNWMQCWWHVWTKRASTMSTWVTIFCNESTQWWNKQQKREQTTLWTLTNENCGPTTKAKTEKKTSRREREGGGKKGENKIMLESDHEEERRARLREKQVIQWVTIVAVFLHNHVTKNWRNDNSVASSSLHRVFSMAITKRRLELLHWVLELTKGTLCRDWHGNISQRILRKKEAKKSEKDTARSSLSSALNFLKNRRTWKF